MTLLDVPPGLNGVPVADTTIGDVLGDEGRYHYRGHDAVELARARSFEEVWHLLHEGALPEPAAAAEFGRRVGAARVLPSSALPIVDVVAASNAPPLSGLRAVLSVVGPSLGIRPMLDLTHAERRDQSLRLAAVVPSVLAALHRRAHGLPVVPADPTAGHAADLLRQVTGMEPDPVSARALEQYLILTIDHGFNASTFAARVVASTGADLVDCVAAALGALAGPLHGGAPGRALDALDAIGEPDRADAWVRAEVAAGRRIMGFGHAVYRAVDPRSTLLRELALELGGPLVERAVAVEQAIVTTLAAVKPDRRLPSNVEYYAGVVMAAVGLPREMFTPTFAVSRSVGWCTHAVEQAAVGKLIRPASRYVGPAQAG